jgi:hypothetical protein
MLLLLLLALLATPASAADPGWLTARAVPEGPVLVDGEPVQGEVELAPGEHLVATPADACFESASTTVRVESGEVTQLDLPRPAKRIRLTVSGSSEAGEAAGVVYADGAVLGGFPGVHDLPRCTAELTFVADGHHPWSHAWVPDRGVAASLHAELLVDPDWDGLPVVSGTEWMSRLPQLEPGVGRGWSGVVRVRVLVTKDGDIVPAITPFCRGVAARAAERGAMAHKTACAFAEPGPPRRLQRLVLSAFSELRFKPWGKKKEASRYWFEGEIAF